MTDPIPTPTETLPQPERASVRGIKIALAVSVALNLAVAGLVSGFVWHGGPAGHGDMMVRDIGFGPFDEALLPEDRDALRKAIRARFGDIRAARRQTMEDAQAILAAMKAEPFDATTLSAALDLQAEHLGDRLEFGSAIRERVIERTPWPRASWWHIPMCRTTCR